MLDCWRRAPSPLVEPMLCQRLPCTVGSVGAHGNSEGCRCTIVAPGRLPSVTLPRFAEDLATSRSLVVAYHSFRRVSADLLHIGLRRSFARVLLRMKTCVWVVTLSAYTATAFVAATALVRACFREHPGHTSDFVRAGPYLFVFVGRADLWVFQRLSFAA